MTNKNAKQKQGFETIAIHAGCKPCPTTGAVVTPIYQNAAYVFRDAKHGADLFSLQEEGYIYSRVNNPTVMALQEKIAELEGGVGATCAASGLAAQMLALYSLMKTGDDCVASTRLYGGTSGQFQTAFPRSFGWKASFADPQEPDAFKANITDKTKCIFIESISNPSGIIADIEAIARVADDAGIPLIVDNTIATPYICRPLDYGASIVTYSTTKFMSGHGNAMGGAVVDGGNFDWKKHANKFPMLTEEDPSYHGVNFAGTFGEKALVMHNHAVGLRDLGMIQQPMNAYLTMTGMETLGLRMQRHCDNALAVAKFLQNHPKVASVNYAGLESNDNYSFAQKYMKGMGGSVFSFAVKNGLNAKRVPETVNMFSHLANIGDTRSLIIHPASTTHHQLTEDQQRKLGMGPEVLRLSIGIETADDIIADLDQALGQL